MVKAPAAPSYPFFRTGDLSAFWALFADNLANIVLIIGTCLGIFGMSGEVVFGRILPGLGVALVSGLGFYAWLARRLGRQEGRGDVTALPYGISTPIMFVYLFGIIGPVYQHLSGAGEPRAAVMAWQTGIAAAFAGGLIEVAGSLVGPWLKRVTPRAGMLGTLAGIALVWIATVPLAEIFEHPLVGFIPLAVILVGLVGGYRLPFGLPAGLAAIAAGTGIGLATGLSKLTFEGVGLKLPVPVLGDLAAGFSIVWENPHVLAVVVPLSIYNFIETMNNVESAEAAGDRFPVATCQVADGVGTLLGALFGSAFPTTVYIGHPGYKRLGGGAGYALGVGVVLFAAATFGLVELLYRLIPAAAVAPILVFIGLVITAQAFRATPSRHAIAVAVAFIPHVANLLVTRMGGVLAATGQAVGPGMDGDLITRLGAQGIHWAGQSALASGSILTGLLWGSLVAFLLDGRPRAAATAALAGAALTLVGVIHSPELGWQPSQIFWGYLLVAALLAAVHGAGLRRSEAEEVPAEVPTEVP